MYYYNGMSTVSSPISSDPSLSIDALGVRSFSTGGGGGTSIFDVDCFSFPFALAFSDEGSSSPSPLLCSVTLILGVGVASSLPDAGGSGGNLNALFIVPVLLFLFDSFDVRPSPSDVPVASNATSSVSESALSGMPIGRGGGCWLLTNAVPGGERAGGGIDARTPGPELPPTGADCGPVE